VNNLCGFFVIQKRVILPQPVARSLAGSLNQCVPADSQLVDQLKQTPSTRVE
jgi:hypothetical protein